VDGTMPPTSHAPVLRDAGLRVTGQRLAVYDEVVRHPHSDVDTIAAGVRSALGSVSTQAVYDALRALTAAGLLRRIEPPGSPARFETRVGDNHHHLVCRTCGALADVDCAVGDTPCLEPSDRAGYVVDEAEVIYWGQCPACRESAGGGASTPASTVSSRNISTRGER
jgi:Fur family ferric uptake transcriptional regulator